MARFLVTGSAGHLGEALIRTLTKDNAGGTSSGPAHEVVGLDLLPSPFTTDVGSIVDEAWVERCMRGVDVVLHTATLHKPHVATHSKRAFVDTNVTGTLVLLEAAAAAGVSSFVFTSTTSAFGSASRAAPGEPATWVTEALRPAPRNVYGVTKLAAEDLCELVHRQTGLPTIVLRTSRFFPEEDDDATRRRRFSDENLKTVELLYRRLDLADAVEAHLAAARRAPELGFGRYVVSATSPFEPEHLSAAREDLPALVGALYPDCEAEFARRSWSLPPGIDRVYVNRRAREELGWQPRVDFRHALDRLRADETWISDLARAVGSKGYHAERFEDGPYPVE